MSWNLFLFLEYFVFLIPISGFCVTECNLNETIFSESSIQRRKLGITVSRYRNFGFLRQQKEPRRERKRATALLCEQRLFATKAPWSRCGGLVRINCHGITRSDAWLVTRIDLFVSEKPLMQLFGRIGFRLREIRPLLLHRLHQLLKKEPASSVGLGENVPPKRRRRSYNSKEVVKT